jgi:hypothetical protein
MLGNQFFSLHRNFKVARLLAIAETLALQAKGTSHSRVKRDALLLTAACVWLVNGLRERPDDGPSWRSLMYAVLPIGVEDDVDLAYGVTMQDEDELYTGTPYYPYGVIFLRQLHLGKGDSAPRMKKGGPFLPLPAIQDLFGETEESLKYRYLVLERV